MQAIRRRQPLTANPNAHALTLLLLLVSLAGPHQPARAQQVTADTTSTNVWLRQRADAEQAAAHINFTNVSQVVLIQKAVDEAERDKTLTITNAAEINRLVTAIRLEYKPSCWCLHQHEATFKTPTGQTRVSFCDHCFDVVSEGKPTLYYKMPAEFLSRLQKTLQAHGSTNWDIPGIYRTVPPQ